MESTEWRPAGQEAQEGSVRDALRLVYSRPAYLVAAALLFAAVAIFYAWAAQVLIASP